MGKPIAAVVCASAAALVASVILVDVVQSRTMNSPNVRAMIWCQQHHVSPDRFQRCFNAHGGSGVTKTIIKKTTIFVI